MPVARYFFIVGGLLLALLFIADACIPKVSLAERPDSKRIALRIRSEMKLPERVVFDTTLPTIVPLQTARPESHTQHPVTTTADVPAAARETLAELQRSNRIQSPDLKKRDVKQWRHRTVARRYVGPPIQMVARQPQFGWFGIRFW
jgi:hypothetical protein